MKRVVSGREMAAFDKYTINEIGIPSLVLMERAALACVDVITENFDEQNKITVLCGPGNNGADGVAIARILKCRNYCNISYTVIGNEEKYTEELRKQISIAENLGVIRCDTYDFIDSDLIVDALFGIGITRDPAGEFAEAIMAANDSHAKVLSVDIPSGINADTGKGYIPHIDADYTVTFQYIKKGHLLGTGYLASDNLTVADIGIKAMPDNGDEFTDTLCCLLEENDIENLIPETYVNDNKGSRGRVLVIAGSDTIYGACYLAAKSAYRTGCGMVKVYTHISNIPSLQNALPEALFTSYTEYDEESLEKAVNWADSILIGPGLSTSETAEKITKYVLRNAKCPLVVDADALNIIAKEPNLLMDTLEILDQSGVENGSSSKDSCIILKPCKKIRVLTPHLKEMSRLCGLTVKEIEDDMERAASDFCKKYGCSMILKNYTSYVYTDDICYINTSGNEGMATAGSGDVLAGITVSLLAQGCVESDVPALAAYIHGISGEKASEARGIRHMMAGDIIDYISF